MKKYLWIFIVSVVNIHALFAKQNEVYGIIPKPAVLIPADGQFVINKRTTVVVENEQFDGIAKNFVTQFKRATGYHLTIKDSSFNSSNSIIFKKIEGLPLEGYELSVTPKNIIIQASESNGVFYGLQSILQLLPPQIYGDKITKNIKWSVPCCVIKDTPRFAYRGLMLDVGRYFMPKEFILKLIDLMSMHKQNMFHWHLTEDQGWRIEIKKYPLLTEIGAFRKESAVDKTNKGDGIRHGGFYTQEDVREIIEYARQRYVTVIPEIELPGHAVAAIASYPQLSCFPDRKYEVATTWGIKKDVFCPNAFTFQFFEDVFTELFTLFPSPYYHTGGDECPTDNWEKCSHCQNLMKILGLQKENELHTFFVTRMEKFLREKGGKTVIGWDEIIDNASVPNTIVMAYRGHARAVKAIQQNQYTILTPNRWCYLDYYQEDPDTEELSMSLFLPLSKVYNYDPVSYVYNYAVETPIKPEQEKYILGQQGCIWTEYISNPKRAEYMAFPRAIAMSEIGWSSKENKDWDSFCKRMIKEFKRLDQKNVNYSKAFYHVIFNYNREAPFPKKVALSLDYPEAKIHYTTNGGKPTPHSPIYSDSIVVTKGDIIKAVGYTKKGTKIGDIIKKQF